METEQIISAINDADEVEILEFDFDPVFDALTAKDARIADLEAEVERLRSVPYDGYTVYLALSDKAKQRTSTENISDVLDAVASVIKAEQEGG